MSLQEKFAALTEGQKKELNAMTTAEEVLAFAKRAGIDVTPEEASEIAEALPDEAMGDVAGGLFMYSTISPRG
jgi:hypothetical protein